MVIPKHNHRTIRGIGASIVVSIGLWPVLVGAVLDTETIIIEGQASSCTDTDKNGGFKATCPGYRPLRCPGGNGSTSCTEETACEIEYSNGFKWSFPKRDIIYTNGLNTGEDGFGVNYSGASGFFNVMFGGEFYNENDVLPCDGSIFNDGVEATTRVNVWGASSCNLAALVISIFDDSQQDADVQCNLPDEINFLGNKIVKFIDQPHSEGGAHSNNVINFAKPGTHTGDLTAVKKIVVGKDQVVMGDATAPKVKNKGTITGTVMEEAVGALRLPNLNFEAVGPDINFGESATVNLTPGTYFIESFSLGENALADLDVAGGPITINVDGKVTLKDGARINVADESLTDQVQINAKKTIKLGKNTEAVGKIIAPEAAVKIGEESGFRG